MGRRPWRRRLLFFLVPLLVLVGALELGLRLAGWEGRPDREVSWCAEHAGFHPPFLQALPLDGDPAGWYGVRLSAHPRPVPVHKAPHERRVFVFGGSAAHGYGFSRNGSFPGRLEVLLGEAYPHLDVQVVNLGTIAASSQQVLQVARDVLERLEPDLFVVYSGNNELLEVFDWRQYLPPRVHRLLVANLRVHLRLNRLRGFTWFREVVRGVDPGVWGQAEYTDDEARPWWERARLTDADRAYAVERWTWNVGRLVSLARRADVPVVLSTVAANWENPPGEFPFDGPEAREPDGVRDRLEEARAALREQGPAGRAAAEAAFRAAWRAWPEAITHHRWGMAYRQAGLPEAARAHLWAAIRLDENPHRVLPEVNEAARRLARRAGVPLVDGEAVVAAMAPDGIIGWAQVYDHCHPSLAAHGELAGAFARVVVEEAIWPGAQVEPAALEARVRAENEVLARREGDSDRVEAWLGVHLQQGGAEYPGDPEGEAVARWARVRAAAEAAPHDAAAWNLAGVVAFHQAHGDAALGRVPGVQDAVDAFRRARDLDPASCVATANLGRTLLAVGRTGEAVALLRDAVGCDPTDAASAALAARADAW